MSDDLSADAVGAVVLVDLRLLLRMDARDPESCLVTLIGVVEHALARSTAG